MKKIALLGILTFVLFSFISGDKEKEAVGKVLNSWHMAAAEAKFEDYFSKMTDSSVFIGTAPGERWNKTQFMAFAKPYFDKGRAWDFKMKSRQITLAKNGKMAWFDEVLDTWMMDCSGSGVLVKEKGEWKIAFYDLHVLIENEKIDSFLDLRKK